MTQYMVLVESKKDDKPPSVICGCGWSFGPCDRMVMLKRQAQNHKWDTGHKIGDKEKGDGKK